MRAHPTRPRTATAVALGAAAALSVLSACGQPTPPKGAPAPTTVDVVIQTTIAPLDPNAPDTAAPDPSDPAAEGLYDASAALTNESCEPQGDSWSFSGTLTNKNATAETYTVGITLLKTSDLSEVFTKEVTVTVPPGQSAPVESKDFHTAPAKGTTCLTGVTVKGQ